MARPPLNVREWLEDMRRFNGRDADRATECLRLLDEARDNDDLLNDYGERVGDIDDAQKRVETLAKMTEWGKNDPTFKEFGEISEETLEQFARAYDKLEAESFALQELMVDVGLLNRHDFTTDPLPLLRMFLPV